MKVIDTYLFNIGPTPREIKTFRKEVTQFHTTLGQPVIFKHRWNLDDVSKGLAVLCPNHNYSYERDKSHCPYCFGTNFLGGFADGVIIFATISDAPVDQLKIGPQGYILYDKHPQFTAPWYPNMGDGDLIIQAEFDRANWSVLATGDRFELNNVTPVTIRGIFGPFTDYKLYKVQQTSEIDRIPNLHHYYDVPIEFDYNSAPGASFAGLDTNIFPFNYNTSIQYPLFLIGQQGYFTSSDGIVLRLFGAGTDSQATFPLLMTGQASSMSIFPDTLLDSSTSQTMIVSA